MIRRTYQIEFLTPCFCGGANPAKAELRASAVRGQLRWWFRSLGGTPVEEREVFGSVLQKPMRASSLTVRIRPRIVAGEVGWERLIPDQGMGPKTYLLGFFCGRTSRLAAGGALPPQTKATVEVLLHRPPTARTEAALRTFFSIGALGFRATRTAGAFACEQEKLDQQAWTRLAEELYTAGFLVRLLPIIFPRWPDLVEEAGRLLKNEIRGRHPGLGLSAGEGGDHPTPLGSAAPRQTSALHFRPVRIDGRLRLALLEAPHHRVLGGATRDHALPVLPRIGSLNP